MAEEITQLLINWSAGDQQAVEKLIPLVYDELRSLARSYLRRERLNHTLQPTALVHEAWLRLVNQQAFTIHNRAQFFGLAATLMRNILVDHARRHRAAKRGGQEYSLSLSQADRLTRQADVSLIALDDALNALAAERPQHARIVELKFFGGLTIAESAQVMNISHAPVERDWAFARAWLKRELSR